MGKYVATHSEGHAVLYMLGKREEICMEREGGDKEGMDERGNG